MHQQNLRHIGCPKLHSSLGDKCRSESAVRFIRLDMTSRVYITGVFYSNIFAKCAGAAVIICRFFQLNHEWSVLKHKYVSDPVLGQVFCENDI